MSPINIEKLLEKISEEVPCGESLEYDPALQALESAATAKSAQEFGDTVVPAEEPNWGKVKMLAIEILLRTKDLHIVTTHLARALVYTDGFTGCTQALSLVRGYIEQYWSTVHPQLDPDDNLDPISRINAINALSDPQTIIQSLRRSPLVAAQGIGVFSLRDMDIASGKITLPKGEEGTPPTQALIDGALIDSSLDELQKTAAAINGSLESVKQIKTLLMALVGMEIAPQLKELSTELTYAQSVIEKELSRRGFTEEGMIEPGAEANDVGMVQTNTKTRLAGEVNSRTDVAQMLDKICAYYSRQEPSSPVPLLLQRTKRLVSMDFMEIVKDLASDGVQQVEKVMGVDEKKK